MGRHYACVVIYDITLSAIKGDRKVQRIEVTGFSSPLSEVVSKYLGMSERTYVVLRSSFSYTPYIFSIMSRSRDDLNIKLVEFIMHAKRENKQGENGNAGICRAIILGSYCVLLCEEAR